MATPQEGPCGVCRSTCTGVHIVANDKHYHNNCFVCFHCLEPFPEGEFFETEGRMLCEADHILLYGSRCASCGHLITTNYISALGQKYHPEHFNCEHCVKPLAGIPFVRKGGKPWCRVCSERFANEEKKADTPCTKCKLPVTPYDTITYMMEPYHCYHFNCAQCKCVLNIKAKEHNGKLYCPEDFDRITSRTCALCRRPIAGRSVSALGKQYHPEHFVCSKCQKPFGSFQWWEYKGKPYCEVHYHDITNQRCALCFNPTSSQHYTASGKMYCDEHFVCISCQQLLSTDGKQQSSFTSYDGFPYCRHCYNELPVDVKKKIYKFGIMEIDWQKERKKVKEKAAAKAVKAAKAR